MLSTLDVLDTNIMHLIALGCEDIMISMPVLHKTENGEYTLASFSWRSVNKKQHSVPKPDHILITPLNGGQLALKDIPDCGIPEVCTQRPMSTWTQRALARDLDEVISDYLATGSVPDYKYLFYLENMLTNYDPCYYPLFKALTDPSMLVEALQTI